MRTLKGKRPSPAMVVSVIALVVALAGTAYAAQKRSNGGAIKKQTIGGGKLKQKTLTGFQINTNKLGTVPAAKRAIHTAFRPPASPRQTPRPQTPEQSKSTPATRKAPAKTPTST